MSSKLTERQKDILGVVVSDYIAGACPISSGYLKKQGYFDLSPAGLRIELVALTKKGFLSKTHISGGRVPTDKGYRFFVDKLLEKNSLPHWQEALDEFDLIFEQMEDHLKFCSQMAKEMAQLTSNLGVVSFAEDALFWKEGWQGVLKAPEFKNTALFKEFAELVSDLEQGIEEIPFGENERIKVFIGRETPFKEKDFTLLIGKPKIKERANQDKALKRPEPTFALLGPKRMDFKTNLSLLNSIIEMVENY